MFEDEYCSPSPCWIVGSGGLALGLNEVLSQQHLKPLILTRKKPAKDIFFSLDYTQEDVVYQFVQSKIERLPHTIFITSGLLHDVSHQPEKSLSQLEVSWLEKSIEANVYPALYFTKALNHLMPRKHRLKLIVFTARVGSISDNRLGGWYSYRMSKAMLNMFIKNSAIEWRLKFPNAGIYGYHPGTVDTNLSKPFQQNLPKEQLFTPFQAAQYCINVFTKSSLSDSGKIVDWQGKNIIP